MSTLLRIRIWLVLFLVGLVLSGVTAFPLESEVRLLARLLHADASPFPEHLPALVDWIDHVRGGLIEVNRRYPFMSYGTDWLAFAHLSIAVAFWGPLRDPVRNVWVVQFGMIASVGIIPLALIAGPVRHIPWGWTLVDLSFSLAVVPLLIAYRLIRRLEREQAAPAGHGDRGEPAELAGAN